MSWLSSAVQSIGNAVNNVFGGSRNILPDIIKGGIGYLTGGAAGGGISSLLSLFGGGGGGGNSILSEITGGIKSLFGGSNNILSTIFSDISGGIKDLFNGGFNSFLSGAQNILSDIRSGINKAGQIEKDVISPIAGLVNGVTKDVQALNDQVIAPIRNLVNTYNKTSTTLLTSIQADIHSGIQGFLKLPQDLADAFTSVDAQFKRATQELGQSNQAIVTDHLVPGLNEGIGGPLKDIHTTLTSPEFTEQDQAAYVDSVKLTYGEDSLFYRQQVDDFTGEISKYAWPLADLARFLWKALKLADYNTKLLEPVSRKLAYDAAHDNPTEILGVGEALEAYRRGFIDKQAWEDEALRHGIGPERQQILYDLAQYMFDARQATELYQRGIISDADYKILIDQNNLSSDQAAALTELMQHTLNPADIAAAVARGYIAQSEAEPMYQAAFVPESLRNIIPELEKQLRSPSKMAALYARQKAADNGFLSESLNSTPPPEVTAQFDRVQAEDGSAGLDWLGHWDVPQAAWWVDAYFRGLRTRTELYNAFEAHNIPQELWDDVIAVEEELPPVWLVPDIVKTGVWGEQEAIPTLMKLGFSEANAKVLYEYGASKASSAAAQTADSLAKVSLGNAKAAFNDGLIDATTYEQILIDHKYTAAAAKLTVELAQFEEAQAKLKSEADLLVSEVQLGLISKTQAESNLYNLGMTTGQVAKYMQKIEKAKVDNAKLPSETQIKDMFKKSIISEEVALSTMELLGYSAFWSKAIMATW